MQSRLFWALKTYMSNFVPARGMLDLALKVICKNVIQINFSSRGYSVDSCNLLDLESRNKKWAKSQQPRAKKIYIRKWLAEKDDIENCKKFGEKIDQLKEKLHQLGSVFLLFSIIQTTLVNQSKSWKSQENLQKFCKILIRSCKITY